MTGKLHLSASPHIHSTRTVSKIMLDVVISLLPAVVASIYYFGTVSLAILCTCVIACIASEFVFNHILKREQTIGDFSAVVTGIILGLNVPANIPLWQVIAGSFFAIIVVKCIFGGIGCNIVNPAATARVFMLISFGSMTKSVAPAGIDAVSGATPLVELSDGSVPDLMDLFLGKCAGSIGETCSVALLIGGIYLLVRRVITWHIPVVYIGSVFVMSYFAYGMNLNMATASILSGGLILGAIFMATDYVTSPSTASGKIIFGVILGMITFAIRFWGTYQEGVSFAILLANILNPYIDVWTERRVFGGAKA